MMTVQGWGLTPGRAPATRPPLPPTLSATRPAQIVFLHSCSSVFVTSKNCISSLTLKCICVPKKRSYMFKYLIITSINMSWYDDVSPFLFDFPSPQIVTQGSYKYFFGLEMSLILCQDL